MVHARHCGCVPAGACLWVRACGCVRACLSLSVGACLWVRACGCSGAAPLAVARGDPCRGQVLGPAGGNPAGDDGGQPAPHLPTKGFRAIAPLSGTPKKPPRTPQSLRQAGGRTMPVAATTLGRRPSRWRRRTPAARRASRPGAGRPITPFGGRSKHRAPRPQTLLSPSAAHGGSATHGKRPTAPAGHDGAVTPRAALRGRRPRRCRLGCQCQRG